MARETSVLLREHPQERLRVYATKKGTDLALYDKRSFDAGLQAIPDGLVVVRVERADEARPLELNRRYFAVLKDIATHRNENEADARHTADTLHERMKALFNGGQSTTTLSAQEFSIYIERVMAHAAAEHGVEFTEPERLFEEG